MAKRNKHIWIQFLPFVVVAVLGASVVVLGPGESTPDAGDLGPVTLESDSLSAGRHYDWVRLDSVLSLVRRKSCSPIQGSCCGSADLSACLK